MSDDAPAPPIEYRLELSPKTQQLAVALSQAIKRMTVPQIRKLGVRLGGKHKFAENPTADQMIVALALLGTKYVEAIEGAMERRLADLSKSQ